MARPLRAEEPVRYDGFPLGMNNRRSDFDLQQGEDGAPLRNAVNVDILASGRVRRRRGLTQRVADANAHSIFSDGVRMVWATPTALKLVGPNLVPTTLLTSVLLATPISYVPLHGEIYFSNERINGKITAANEYTPWGITPPSSAPTLAATAGDRFVQVTCTFVIGRPDAPTSPGEESGAPLGVVVSCTDTPSIRVTNIPQSSDSRVRWTRIYVTALNGTVFYSEVDVPAGVTAVTLNGKFGLGQRLETQFMQPPPPGQLLTYSAGRLHIASGNNVFSTRPLRYGLYDPEEDFLMYPERVTLLKGVEDGVYLSVERTYFVPGVGTPGVKPVEVFDYRAIEGAACDVAGSSDVMWLSERGLIRAANGGAAKNLTEEQIAIETVSRACLGPLEYNGHKAVLAIAEEGKVSSFASTDFVAAEAARLANLE
jgi:hypothetical protein